MTFEPISRRELLLGAGALATTAALGAWAPRAEARMGVAAPTSPVALGRCESYSLPQLTDRLSTLFDRIGGIKSLVAGKTVAIKVNLTGSPGRPVLGLPAYRTYHIHPNLALALASLLDRAGAKRIRFVEGTYSDQPFHETLRFCGWDLVALAALKAQVEFEDTRNLGNGRRYTEIKVPWGGDLYPAYMLNHSYADCDTYISLAKLKNHVTAGVTLSMKNNFGITPTALYAQAVQDEHSTLARAHVIHDGAGRPAPGLPAELASASPRVPSHRVPRHIVDVVGIRPIDLALIDGIETVSGGEGPWCDSLTVRWPRLLIAGRNAVCTDAVAMLCMGYNPRASAGTGPFPGANHLVMAAERGIGTNDPARIEVVGLPLAEAHYPFEWQPDRRNT